jgi:glutamine synthetase
LNCASNGWLALVDEKAARMASDRAASLRNREAEPQSRAETLREQYALTINIEAATTSSLARTVVLPAALRYIAEIGLAAEALSDLKLDDSGARETAKAVVEPMNALRAALSVLSAARNAAHETDAVDVAMQQTVVPALAEVRSACDALEKEVPADLWPLPTYREMLFVK